MLDVINSKKPGNKTWRKPLVTDVATGDVTVRLWNGSSAWAYLSNIRSGQPFFLRYEITGPELEAGTSEVQTVDLSATDDPTGGVWPLTILGTTITGIPWNVTAAELQATINSLLEADGADEVTVGKSGFIYTFTYPARLGNVAQATGSAVGLTTGGGNTVTVANATTTPGVASIRYLCALDCGVMFKAHFKPSDIAPLSVLDFLLQLRQNSDINGWRVTTITGINDLALAA
jgi:hypothetical protein